MRVNCYKLSVAIAVFFASFFILYLYVSQIQHSNAYIGYLKIGFDAAYILLVLAFLLPVVFFIPPGLERPSDFFFFFHAFLVLVPYIILHPAGSSSNDGPFILFLFILVLPLFTLLLIRELKIKIPSFRKWIGEGLGYYLVAFFSVLVVFLALMNAPSSSGFDMATSYVRRLEGREVYPVGSFYAYANSIVMNGFLPLLSFWAGLRKSYKFFLVPLFIWLSFYYLLGVKAPLLMAIISFIFGYFYHSKKVSKIFFLFVCGVVLVCLFSLFEYFIFGYSYIGDYFIRRAFTVPPFLISIYGSFFSSGVGDGWSLLSGLSSEKPISFIIGEDYMGLDGLNANSNTFISSFIAGGVFSYLMTFTIVVLFFSYLDAVYRGSRSPNMMFCGFIYALLLVEQNATTALISSGVFFVLLVTSFTGSNNVLVKR